MNYKALQIQVKNALETYGVPIEVYREKYESEVGVQVYKGYEKVAEFIGVLDNSGAAKVDAGQEDNFRQSAITGSLYYPFIEGIDVRANDFIILSGIKYTLTEPVDVLHVGVLYQCGLRGVKNG